jgi:DnaJ-class molecular chaperone
VYGEATEMFKCIAEAYSVLGDQKLREAYNTRDRSRDSSGGGSEASGATWAPHGFRFTADMAKDLFRNTFGDEVVANLAMLSQLGGRATAPIAEILQDAGSGAASVVAGVSDRVRKADIVRGSVLSGLVSLQAERDAEVETRAQVEEQCRRIVRARRQEMDELEDQCAASCDERARRLRIMSRNRKAIVFVWQSAGLPLL